MVETDNRNNQVTKTGVLSEDIGHLSKRVSFPFSTNSRRCLLLGTDHLTCKGVMVFCFVQNFFPLALVSGNFFLPRYYIYSPFDQPKTGLKN